MGIFKKILSFFHPKKKTKSIEEPENTIKDFVETSYNNSYYHFDKSALSKLTKDFRTPADKKTVLPSDTAPTFTDHFYNSSYYTSTKSSLADVIKDQGRLGEMMVCNTLDRLPFYKRILTNVYLPTQKGSTEIDILLFTAKGIYVIENKNYSTSVYGNAKSQNWTAYYNGQPYPFYNPVLQNKGHIRAILENVSTFRIKFVPVISVVVFSDRCKLKISGDFSHVSIIHRAELSGKIKAIEDSLNPIFSTKDIDVLYSYFFKFAMQDEATKQRHIAYVSSLKKPQS